MSAFIMVWKPLEKPISPVMPTSYGLSYSTCSFPRRACTTGALSLPANSTSSLCAPAQPLPHIRAILLEYRSSCASFFSSSSAGVMVGCGAEYQWVVAVSGAAFSATSPAAQPPKPRDSGSPYAWLSPAPVGSAPVMRPARNSGCIHGTAPEDASPEIAAADFG